MHVKPWGIGLFIVVGFGLFAGILFLIGNRHEAFSKHMELYSEFSNLSGLGDGAKVRVSGLDAGEIKQIEIPKSPSAKFRLRLQIQAKLHELIRKDSVVSIETEGIVGDKFISIKKGTQQAEEVGAGFTLPSKEPFEMAELMEKGSGLLNDLQGGVKDIRGRLDISLDSMTKTVNHADSLIVGVQPNINRIANNGSQIAERVNALVADLNQGKGPAGMLLKDEEMKQQIQATLKNIQRASANLNQMSTQAEQVVADFQSRNLIAKAQVTLENVQSISNQIDNTVKAALAKDNMGEDGASNLRETLSNLNRSTTNLAEDTEALKHNFFLRGFFKKRGFYNLEQLTPSQYLLTCEHQKNLGSRLWLNASNLVVSDTEGQEQLSDAGQHQIDTKVALEIDSLPQYVIVVEGYSETGSPDQQFVTSRRRADLVRRYLQMHYHLRPSDLGIVPLRNKPPEGSGRDSWDGAAIMLLKVKFDK